MRGLTLTATIAQHPTRLLIDVVKKIAADHGEAPALLSDRGHLTFVALVQRSNQYSRWALARGVRKGDTVALLMRNRPDYLAAWLGITAVGGVVALVNDQLRDPAIAHCIAIVGARRIIAAAEFAATLDAISLDQKPVFDVWLHDAEPSDPRNMDEALAACSTADLTADERVAMDISDRALCIYTSGTTGLPKAANVSHRRILSWSFWFAGLMDAQPGDRMYNCLPMHHSVGGVVAVGSMLVTGGSTVLRERFSVRDFWADVMRWDCTLFQYIGELCRYLVNAPPSEFERAHRLRLCTGNGLQGDVWERFQGRFNIPRILEFYAASECSFSLFNVDGKPGAIGRVPGFLSHRFPADIVRIEADTDAAVRGSDGRCIRCAVNEVGEAIGRLSSDGSGITGRFEGYTDAAESERKILRDVFEPGDAWFRTGDLMRRDAKHFYYFVDRIGDTFRWKGENVSTTEVAGILGACTGVVEAVVYGVAIPQRDGRAGMAALVVDEAFAPERFWQAVTARLPPFAQPVFLRLRDSFAITATFKSQKADLKREGFDPTVISDPLYVADAAQRRYRRFDAADFRKLSPGSSIIDHDRSLALPGVTARP
jgi:fatty-acyl-CoA synthase